jgi:hypothetical protein
MQNYTSQKTIEKHMRLFLFKYLNFYWSIINDAWSWYNLSCRVSMAGGGSFGHPGVLHGPPRLLAAYFDGPGTQELILNRSMVSWEFLFKFFLMFSWNVFGMLVNAFKQSQFLSKLAGSSTHFLTSLEHFMKIVKKLEISDFVPLLQKIL